MTVPEVVSSDGFRDPLEGPLRSERYWTTNQAGEGLPGVPTPLTWSWYSAGAQEAMRLAWVDLGVIPRRSARPASADDDQFLMIFNGRPAVNVDLYREMADGMPGTSATALERDFLGTVRTELGDRPRRGRYPVVAVMFPGAAWAARRRVRAFESSTRSWWVSSLASIADGDLSVYRRRFAESKRLFADIARPHIIGTMIAQGAYEQLRSMSADAGLPGAESTLVTGLGSMEEGNLLTELWTVARERRSIDDLVERFGYQGPYSGELLQRPWREDRAPLEKVLERYAQMNSSGSPAAVTERQREARLEAQRHLLGSLPRCRRVAARICLHIAAAYLPLREMGRASILRAVDVARASARAVGAEWCRSGLIADPDDVFFMSAEELLGDAERPGHEEILFRRERRSLYEASSVPHAWQGRPGLTEAVSAHGRGAVTGLGASSGVVEGTVRVISDPATEDIEPGEILVCRLSDPSWATLFHLASAVVIDLGGPISHGAVVAREMGIPCVIGTENGSLRLRTGDVVRVNGTAGTVEVVGPAA